MAMLGRQAALEGSYFFAEEQRATARLVEQMIAEGKLPKSAIEAMQAKGTYSDGFKLPTTVVTSTPEFRYRHVKQTIPTPRLPTMDFGMGGRISLGRAKWSVEGTSIFSVSEGKRLAQLPQREPTAFERLRAAKISKAAMESPVVNGLRLLPVFTPGRALMWGSILALWGTAAVVMSTSRGLGIKSKEEAPEVLRDVLAPVGAFVAEHLLPIKSAVDSKEVWDQEPSELARRIKAKLQQ